MAPKQTNTIILIFTFMRIFTHSLLYLLIFSGTCLAQRHTLKGNISDASGDKVPSVLVRVMETSLMALSNEEGDYEIKGVPSGSYKIAFSMTGYHTFETSMVLSGTTVFTLDVKLVEKVQELPQMTIVASRDRLFSGVPGSVSVIQQAELQKMAIVSGDEVFRRVAGLHVYNEDPAGLRVNIGIRGLDPDKSRNVLILEDGVPVALNPYGEPEMYYTPEMDRMESVEVLKGSGQILYGPQTTGGVINYITPSAPDVQSFRLRTQAGQGGYLSNLLSYGNTIRGVGVQVSYLRRQAYEMGALAFRINDLNAKITMPLSKKSLLGVKVSAYRENSNATYVGLTQAMFDQGGNDFTVLAPFDELNVSRYALSMNHQQQFGNKLKLQSTFFTNTTARNWRRQDYSYNVVRDGVLQPPPTDWTGVVWGDESIHNGAIYMRNRTGNRNRQFEVLGWEQKLVGQYNIGGLENTFTAGYRYMYERAYEQRINGTNAQALSGALVSDEIRTGNAVSLFAINKISVNNRLELSPGIRFESYQFERKTLREASRDTTRVADNMIQTLIPGVGASYKFRESFNVFSGIHKGYAPPRLKDAIDFTAENPVLELDAEQSWNFELGFRAGPASWLFAEVTFFHMDFANQIIPSSQSIGGVGFGFVNAGRTLHQGIETSFNFDVHQLLNMTRWEIEADLKLTQLRAVYNADRVVEDINVRGNRLPYAPKLTVSYAVSVASPWGTAIRLTHTYISNQVTEPLNNVEPTNNGRDGLIQSFSLIDATLSQKINRWEGSSFFLSIRNLTNERYIATRRPEGIRVGLPRFVTAGVDLRF
jgi:Fe(3+) dicitrate transport protein